MSLTHSELYRARRGEIALGAMIWVVLCLVSPGASAPRERQTKLLLPSMTADARAELVPQVGQQGGISAVAFSPDEMRLASGSYDRTIVIWDLANGLVVRRLREHPAPVGSIVFSADGKRFASASRDGTVIMWDALTGQVQETLRVGDFGKTEKWAADVALDGQFQKLASLDFNGVITIWNVRTGQAQSSLRWDQRIGRVAISADGSKIAGATESGTIVIWRLATGRPEKVIRAGSGPVAFSPDGRIVASETLEVGSTALMEAGTGKALASFQGRSTDWGQAAESLTFSRDGTRLASGSWAGRIVVRDVRSGNVERVLDNRAWPVSGVAFAPDGKRLVSTSHWGVDNDLTVWQMATGEAENTTHVGDFSFHRELSTSTCLIADGQALVMAALDGSLWIGDLRTGVGKRASQRADGLEGRPSPPLDWRKLVPDADCRTVEAAAGIILSGAVSPDRKRVALGIGNDGLGSRRVRVSQPNTIVLWDLTTRRVERVFGGHRDSVWSVTFCPDGSMLASGAYDGEVILWDVLVGKAKQVLKGHADIVACVAFSPDGRHLVTGSQDGTVRVWNVGGAAGAGRGREAATFIVPVDTTNVDMKPPKGYWRQDEPAPHWGSSGRRDWLATTPQGYYDCSLEAAGFVVWRMGDSIYPFDQFSEKFHRPDLVRKALAGEDISNAPLLDGTQIPPNIAFASPEYGAEVTGETVDVVIEAAGVRPIQRLELSVNGRVVSPTVAGKLEVADAAKTERTFLVTVPLPPNEPTVRLRAVAYDTELLKSRAAELFLRRAGMKEQPGKLYVLSVGVSRYQNSSWNTIQYADADAKAFAEAFGGGQSGQYSEVKRRVLVNEEATVSNLKFALREFKDTVSEGDVAVVFVAGHGIEQGQDYYFLCHDTREADLANTALPWQDFVGVLREVRAKRLLLFVDTCHAGFVTGWRTTDNIIDRLNRKAGALVFTASRGEEASIERADWGHGAFTKGLLEGLEGKADTEKDGRITLQELRDYVIPRVEALTDNRQHPYLPRLQDFEPQAVIALGMRQ